MGERSDLRIDAAVGVVVRYSGGVEPCLSRSLSTGGISVGTQKRWPPGTVVDLEIVHEGTRVRVPARVVSQMSTGVGLEFVDPTPEQLQSLQALLSRLLPTGDTGREVPPDALRALTWMPVVNGKRPHKARIIDLSHDGAAIADKSPPEVGAEITVAITNPVSTSKDDSQVKAGARVVRHTERGFAVQFVGADTAFKRAVSIIRKAARTGKT